MLILPTDAAAAAAAAAGKELDSKEPELAAAGRKVVEEGVPNERAAAPAAPAAPAAEGLRATPAAAPARSGAVCGAEDTGAGARRSRRPRYSAAAVYPPGARALEVAAAAAARTVAAADAPVLRPAIPAAIAAAAAGVAAPSARPPVAAPGAGEGPAPLLLAPLGREAKPLLPPPAILLQV